MSNLPKSQIWAEMARRKVQFHKDEEWDKIRLWGLFQWQAISKLIAKGELLTDMKKENRILWVWPSKNSWEKHIKPLVESHSLAELTRMAGW